MEFLVYYFIVALVGQILYIKCAFASSMWIARKTAKLFTCLGGLTQLRQSIISLNYNIKHLPDLVHVYWTYF